MKKPKSQPRKPVQPPPVNTIEQMVREAFWKAFQASRRAKKTAKST